MAVAAEMPPGPAEQAEQQYLWPIEIPVEAIQSKIVEKCGDKIYWENWAKDVAEIFQRLVDRLENLLGDIEKATLRKKFDDFHTELKETINTSITRDNAIDMMVQHILTSPVFNALFEDYDFASGNPVAIALDNLQKDFSEFGLENETRDLRGFYNSVRKRASGVNSSEGRQEVLSDLYEQFFKKAYKKRGRPGWVSPTHRQHSWILSCRVSMIYYKRSLEKVSVTKVFMC